MKRIILPLLGFLSVLILGCNRDAVMPQLNTSVNEPLRSLDFSGVSRISGSSGTRGFSINASYDAANSKNIGSISFATGSWSSRLPKVIFMVKNVQNNKILWARQLKNADNKLEYEYKGGAKPEVRFHANIKYGAKEINNQKLFIYIFDSELNSTCEPSTDGYNVTIAFPSLSKEHTDDKFYILKPASDENQKLIFSTDIPIETIVNNSKENKRTIIDNVNPLGTLILFSFRNVSDKVYSIYNGYQLKVKTNGFTFENAVIDCAKNNHVSHSSIYPYVSSDDRTAYGSGSDGHIDYNNALGDAYKLDYIDIRLARGSAESIPAMQKPNTYHNSNIYALYVMPTSSDLVDGSHVYNMLNVFHPYDDGGQNIEARLFYPNKLFNFYDANHKALSLVMDVPYGVGNLSTLSDFGDSNGLSNNLGDRVNGNGTDFDNSNSSDNQSGKNGVNGNGTDFDNSNSPDNQSGKNGVNGNGTDFDNSNSPDNQSGKNGVNGNGTDFGNSNSPDNQVGKKETDGNTQDFGRDNNNDLSDQSKQKDK